MDCDLGRACVEELVRLLIALAIGSLLASTGAAGAVEDKECLMRMRSQLVAPLEPQIILGTEQQLATRSGGRVYAVCFQARTQGGGFRKIGATCTRDAAGKIIATDVSQSAMSPWCP
jgi:hypothetical protein